MDKPQIIEHVHQDVNYTVYDVKWIPCSAKFVVLGSKPNGKGIVQIYELNNEKLDKVLEFEKKCSLKCGSFGAARLRDRHMAMADFEGQLQVVDLESAAAPVYDVKAHDGIINCIDAIGGKQRACGPPEIVTGGRDGAVKVWDIRKGGEPVVDITPDKSDAQQTRDCWAVAFGNAHSAEERFVAAGYDNGDLKLFDLRRLAVCWETSLKNGICGMEFDRKDIPMNKLAITTLEGGLQVFDMRTQHATKGFACVEERNAGRSVGSNGIISGPKATVWAVRHLPQNRDLFVSCGGTGSLRLWQYEYPEKRQQADGDGINMGVAGTLNLLNATTVSSQPVHCFDWHPDKMGLAVCGAFDQSVRVFVTTKLNCY